MQRFNFLSYSHGLDVFLFSAGHVVEGSLSFCWIVTEDGHLPGFRSTMGAASA